MNQRKILLVEDETSLAHLVSIQLKSFGYNVKIASDGGDAKEYLESESFDLVLLDWMLPGESGVEVLRFIRRSNKPYQDMPVIFVTALSSPTNIIQGLELGADDYLTKPFEESVLVARINAVLRRANKKAQQSESQKENIIKLGELEIDGRGFEASLKGKKLNLTRSEFLLLKNLIEEQGCVLTREDLISKIQGTEVNVTGRTIDTHIFGLRKKLSDYASCIETIRGVGYRVNALD